MKTVDDKHALLFTRLLPITLLVTGASAVFMWFAFTPEMRRIEGSPAYFADELRTLGPMSVYERWGLAFFAAATLLVGFTAGGALTVPAKQTLG